MASPPASRQAAAPAEQALLPDEILEDIFLLLDSGYDLARASTTCRAFRRVATGRRFLRRFLSLHPPPIVGLIDFRVNEGLYPAEPPHRSASAARAVAQAGDFTFSFLPGASDPSTRWRVRDTRDGLFLLSRESTDAATTFLELVVCDPLYRRYVQIPLIPGDVVPRTPPSDEKVSEPFLAPADEGELGEGSHFRVIYNWLSNYKLVSFVFSTATGKWCCATTFSFLPYRFIRQPKTLVRYYARSCFYWARQGEGYILMLDPCEMKFSLVVGLLHRIDYPALAIADAAEDRLGLFTLVLPPVSPACGMHNLDLYSRTCQNNGSGEEWRRDNCIALPERDYWYCIISTAESCLLLKGSSGPWIPMEERTAQGFTVDLKTLLIERLCSLSVYTSPDTHPYASFPPPFSLPSYEMSSSREQCTISWLDLVDVYKILQKISSFTGDNNTCI